MFYDLYCKLCDERGVTPTRAAVELGMSKGTPTTWKRMGTTPQAAQLTRLAEYFGVTVDYLLTGDETKKAPASSGGVTDDDIKAALFGGAGDVTDEMWDEVRRFAAYVRAREAEKDDGAVQASRGK